MHESVNMRYSEWPIKRWKDERLLRVGKSKGGKQGVGDSLKVEHFFLEDEKMA